jgi:hypothetical protein
MLLNHRYKCGKVMECDGRNSTALDGVILCTAGPFKVNHIRFSFFDSQERFPEGSIEFDSALYMHDIEHEWQPLQPLATVTEESQRL